MTWLALQEEIAAEFIDAQQYTLDRLRRNGWLSQADYVARQKARKKVWSLKALRKRIHARAVIACKNPKCRAEFVPYHALTTYCTIACRVRALALQAYHAHRQPNATRVCPMCAESFCDRRRQAIYCSVRCNRRAVRARGAR